jgi:hypothetical protein
MLHLDVAVRASVPIGMLFAARHRRTARSRGPRTVARHSSNVQRIRRPLTVRHVLRGLVFTAGLVGGLVTAWVVVPRSDLLAFDLGLAQGAAAGALIGLCLSVMIRLPSTPRGPAKPRPSNFEALVAALDDETVAPPRTDAATPGAVTTPATTPDTLTAPDAEPADA